MKIPPTLRIAFAGVFLLFLNACATNAPTAAGPLVGTWTNSLGTAWTRKPDGTVNVVNPKRHIWGTYTVAGDTVTIQETGGKTAKGCKALGAYKLRRAIQPPLTCTFVSAT